MVEYLRQRSAIEAAMWLSSGKCTTPLRQMLAAYDVLGGSEYRRLDAEGTLDEWIHARLPGRLKGEWEGPCIAATANES